MKKLSLLILSFVLIGASAQAQSIIKSLERTVPGQGKVTIHQDPRIEALLGVERSSIGEQKVIKTTGFRIQAYAGNNTRAAKNDAYGVAARVRQYFPNWPCTLLSIRLAGSAVWVTSAVSKKRMP